MAQAPQPAAEPGSAPFGPYETVTALPALEAWIAEAIMAGVVGLDTETDSLDALHARLVGLCLATAPGRACYVPLRHVTPGAAQADAVDVVDARRAAVGEHERHHLAAAIEDAVEVDLHHPLEAVDREFVDRRGRAGHPFGKV